MGIGFVFVGHNTTSKMLLRSCNCNFFAAIIAVTILLIGDGLALSSPSTTHGRLVGYNRYNDRRLVLYATSIDDDEQVREDDELQITDIISRDDDSESSSSSTNTIKRQQQQKPSTYTTTQVMSLMGTSPRRIFLSLATSTTIALAGNLFGVTSNVLQSLPEATVEKIGLDTYYPVGDYKRVVVRGSNSMATNIPGSTNSGKCSFLIPKDWVADTSLALAQAQRQAKMLDYTMNNNSPSNNVLPDAAYGPPGKRDREGLSNIDTNVSVIINTDVTNFSLESNLGNDPKVAAETLLSKRKRPTTLLSAYKVLRGDDTNKIPVYQFEYTVDRGETMKDLHAISVVAGSADGKAFITMTVVSTNDEWETKPIVDERLRKVADSFKLV